MRKPSSAMRGAATRVANAAERAAITGGEEMQTESFVSEITVGDLMAKLDGLPADLPVWLGSMQDRISGVTVMYFTPDTGSLADIGLESCRFTADKDKGTRPAAVSIDIDTREPAA